MTKFEKNKIRKKNSRKCQFEKKKSRKCRFEKIYSGKNIYSRNCTTTLKNWIPLTQTKYNCQHTLANLIFFKVYTNRIKRHMPIIYRQQTLKHVFTTYSIYGIILKAI